MGGIVSPEDVYAAYADEGSGDIVVPLFGILTSADEVRSVFGLSEAELPSDMLLQRVYARETSAALLSVSPNLKVLWADPTKAAPELRLAVESFALYFIASRVCEVLPLVVARTLSDSKATFQRFDTDLNGVIANVKKRFALAQSELKQAAGGIRQTELEIRVGFAAVKPSYDPVTGG